jgi:acyl carrier protein
MANVDVIALFRQAAREIHDRQFDDLSKATVISTLGLDSIAVIEMAGFLEDTLDIQIPDAALSQVETLGDLDALIQRLARAKETA